MSQLVLPEDKVERNLNSFRRYRREGNPLVERVYSGETTFSDETIELKAVYTHRGEIERLMTFSILAIRLEEGLTLNH